MKVFLSIKYYDDMRNKDIIEKICFALREMDVFVFVRDIQNYKKCTLSAEEIMKTVFKEIDSSDVVLVEASELSIGVGIEAGYAYSNGIKVYLTAHKNSYVSNSIKAISSKTLFYNDTKEIINLFGS